MHQYIFHITRKDDWTKARFLGAYMADSLASQGFIHCSTQLQVVRTANAFYHAQPDLVLLKIEEERVKAPIRYENLEGGTAMFPHIYGPLNLDAVLKVADFPPQGDGTFKFPAELER